ncbi:MAG: tetratricopeptide repeat protein, partial [Polyangiaceae bacterium]
MRTFHLGWLVAGCTLFSASSAIAAPPDATTARAETLFHSGKRDEAVKLVESVQTAQTYASRRAHLALGEFRIAMGKRADAEAPLMEIISDYNSDGINSKDAAGLALVGRAATLLRSPKDANKAFNEAERVDKKNVEARLWHAQLFLDTYDPGHAEEVTNEALAIEPKNARAMVMLARIKLEQTLDFDAAEKLLTDALAIDPNLADAYAVRAGIALRDSELASAETSIKKGLSIDPNNLELLSLRAAERFLDDDKAGFETAKKATFAKNAEFAQFYEIVSEYMEWEHRYDDIVAMMKEATKLDPDDGKAWGELGLTQSRDGDEPGGLASLKTAWSKDHFNIRVYNTLNLYDNAIANDYDTTTTGFLRVRYPKDEEPVLSRYVPKMLGEAWGSMKARYDFVPQTPVAIELYSNREQFSVRTSGLPNIGIQGVCFGRVVAAMSPKSEPFNWGNVVWHELGHVFAIQLSKSHVPRWFTEGLSEYETIARRPEWRRSLDPQLYLAIKRGTLPHALDMNRAFTHATDAEDVTVAYYAASQMMVFTVETYGMNKVSLALKLWGQGVKTPDVISKAFGVSGADYDAAFRAWALARMKRYDAQFVFDDRGLSLDDAKKALVAAPADANA